MAGDLWYSFRVAVLMAFGTVWSLPPAVTSRGPRVLLRVLTLVGDRGAKFATATSKSGLPGDGTFQWSYSSSDSRSGRAFPNPYRNSSLVSDTACLRLAGERSPIEATRNVERGRLSTPLMGPGSMATAAAARSWPSSRWAIRPPKE